MSCSSSARILFDSADSRYKYPFGCIKEGESCKISVAVPLSCPSKEVIIVLNKEGGQELTVPLCSVFDEGDYRYYSGEFSLDMGLYFYYFVVKKPDSSFKLFKFGDHDTNMEDGEKWQITCLPRDYAPPKGFGGRVMYQIFPDRFHKSGECDLTDKIKPFTLHKDITEPPLKGPDEKGFWNTDFYGGNLRGIEEKLPYLKSLGVGVIYLNPIFMAHSNHRYDTADYMRIDPMLGDEEDFVSLCKSAKAQDISIILDGVFSHVGSNSRYFDSEKIFGHGAVSDESSPYRDWFDFEEYPDKYDCWWDILTLPCVKELSSGFVDLIIENQDSVVAHWLRLGAKGFRLDVADELPDEFIARLRRRVKEIDPDAIVIGEVWEDASNKISYDVRRKYFSGGELDGVMNYPFRDAIINLLCRRIDSEEFKRIIDTLYEHYPFEALNCSMTFLSSHDTTRIQTELGREIKDTVKALKLASAIQFFLPGMPSIYYGDEVGMTGGSDPFNRGYFCPTENADTLTEHYKMLAGLRNNTPALQNGTLNITLDGDKVTLTRSLDGESISLTFDPHELNYQII